MKITKVRVGKTRSIKVADYQYFKPMVELEAEVEEGNAMNSIPAISTELSHMVDIELDAIVAQESVRFKTVVEVRDLKRVMNENHENSAEYSLAKTRLEEIDKNYPKD